MSSLDMESGMQEKSDRSSWRGGKEDEVRASDGSHLVQESQQLLVSFY